MNLATSEIFVFYSSGYSPLLTLIILVLKLSQIWVREPLQALFCSFVRCLFFKLFFNFLGIQDVLGSSCVFPALFLKSAFIQKFLVPLSVERYLEI